MRWKEACIVYYENQWDRWFVLKERAVEAVMVAFGKTVSSNGGGIN